MSKPALKFYSSKTILQNCLLLLKYPILASLTLWEIKIFQISFKKVL